MLSDIMPSIPSLLHAMLPVSCGLTLLLLGRGLRDMMQVPVKRSGVFITAEASISISAGAIALSGAGTGLALAASAAGLLASSSARLQPVGETARLLLGTLMFAICILVAQPF